MFHSNKKQKLFTAVDRLNLPTKLKVSSLKEGVYQMRLERQMKQEYINWTSELLENN